MQYYTLSMTQKITVVSSQSTQTQVWHFTAAALTRAFDDGIIVKNPAAKIKAPQGGNVKQSSFWTQSETIKALEVLRGHDLECLIRFMLTTGVRPGEALALRWQDVDFQAHRVSIVRTVERPGKNPVFGTPKSKSSEQAFLIDSETLIMLEQHREQQILERKTAKSWADHGLVFPSKVGTPLDHRSRRFSRAFAHIAKKAGVKHLTPHELRHTYRTIARQSGISTKLVSSRMGHASERITEVYDHTHQDELEQRRAALPLAVLLGIPNDSLTASETAQNNPKDTKSKPASSDVSSSENNVQDNVITSEASK